LVENTEKQMADAAEERPRVDGFTWPPHNFQLSSWALFIGFVGSFFALFLAPLEEGARVAAGCVYGVLAALTLVGALTATGKNPADPLIYAASPPEGLTLHYCYRCKKNVQPSSKHCTICRKCVDVFDRA
jgi:hypothetical protein